jgi:UDP-3-O-[3-hydroxymyristoyl] glucosamine N-acyltransferase
VTVTVRELAEWVDGDLVGAGDVPITGARPLSETRDGDVTFVEDLKHYSAWQASAASAAFVPTNAPAGNKPVVRVPDPLAAFAEVVRRLHGRDPAPAETARIDPTARIHPKAVLAPDVSVGPYAVIGEGSRLGARNVVHAGVVIGRYCTLGDDVVVHPHAVLYDDTVVGNRVIVHAHVVLGADGFGYRTASGKHVKTPQLGCVEVADDVEIGAGATVDRGTFGPTRIGVGTKIDNLVMVGHNCQVGKHNLLCSQVGIAGSVTTGDYVVMAGQVGVADHLVIGDRVMIGAKSGVHTNIEPGNRMLGYPVMTYYEQLRMVAALRKLPAALAELKRLTELHAAESGAGPEKAAA